jgi:uncharacterized cupredoxin-like copper-binding protein
MSFPRILSAAGAAVALAAVAAGCGNSTSAASHPPTATTSQATPAGDPIQATLNEWSLGVTAPRAQNGKVTFTVSNAGKLKHEFVVLRTSRAADQLGSATKVSEAGNVGETGDIAAGSSKTVTIALKPGHYSLVCNLPGHYKLGMHTDFTVG